MIHNTKSRNNKRNDSAQQHTTDNDYQSLQDTNSDVGVSSSQNNNSSHSQSFSSENQLSSPEIEQMIKSPLTPKSNISVQFQQPPTVLRRSERIRNPPAKLNDYVKN